ncbi:MAG: radA [Bacillales bacterium]|jgi:DNA repair protein RadA/Sms|nr:radA [Bacillales bacterium]
MAKKTIKFVCGSCGYESAKWVGKCPGCNDWNTMVEETSITKPNKRSAFTHSQVGDRQKPISITKIETKDEPRVLTNSNELDRTLGGGIVPGSLVLIGGDPGIGKSTLLLQVSSQLANAHHKILYISGEESVKQTKLRALRLGVTSDNLYVFSETDMETIEEAINQIEPKFVVVDSIQTVFHGEVPSAPGSVTQVRECTAHLMRIAKTKGIAIFIVGHVTKEGSIAGPRILEHMVDTVLYFEGERHHTYRILRAVKNRFGSTNELGIFEMKEDGLDEVENPSEIFLEERSKNAAGSTVVATIEGTRPVLVEIQSLIAPSIFPNPRRTASGIDQNRVALLMAVLEKRCGLLLQNQDAYLKVTGGMKLYEPAIDLAVAVSIASGYRDQPSAATDCIVGEVGLTGEVRRVSRIETRIKEAEKLGFKRIIVPANNLTGLKKSGLIEVIGVHTVKEALKICLNSF